MGYNYGAVGYASVTSGSRQLVTAGTGDPGMAVRVFDFAMLSTATGVNLYAGSSTVNTSLVLVGDKNNMYMHSDVGYRFVGGVWAASTNTAVAGNIATINYIHEF